MTEETGLTKSEDIGITDLQRRFLSLRVGEEIPKLEIAKIRKVTGGRIQDHLSGVDYCYVVESKEHRLLKITSWALWRKVAAALRQAGKTQVVLRLNHRGVGEYDVEVV